MTTASPPLNRLIFKRLLLFSFLLAGILTGLVFSYYQQSITELLKDELKEKRHGIEKILDFSVTTNNSQSIYKNHLEITRQLGVIALLKKDGSTIFLLEESKISKAKILKGLKKASNRLSSFQVINTVQSSRLVYFCPTIHSKLFSAMAVSTAFSHGSPLGVHIIFWSSLSFFIFFLSSLFSKVISRLMLEPIIKLKDFINTYRPLTPHSSIPVEDFPAELSNLSLLLQEKFKDFHILCEKNQKELSKLKIVLDNMKEAVFLIDSSKKIISINKAAAQLFQIERKRIVSMPLGAVIRELELKEFINEVFQKGKYAECELSLLVGSHELQKRNFFVRAVVISGREQGDIAGVLVVMDDHTELKKLERVRQDFIANVTHELKTPITAIRGYCETLLELDITTEKTVRKFLEIIDRQSKRLETLVEDILLLSSIEANDKLGRIERDWINLEGLFNSVINTCSPKLRENNLTIETQIQPDDLCLYLNEFLMEQLLTNLINNAIQHSKSNGKILLRAYKDHNWAIIEVEDFGVGISKEHLPRIFERFYLADKKNKKKTGTGLGLAIAKHIALAHNGSIEVTSTVGKGTKFTIKLPLSKN